MQTDWEIKARSHCCARTGREFQDGESFYTLLFRDGDGFRREDLSEEAWKDRASNEAPFSFWKAKYEAPPPPPPEPLPKGDAEDLLRRLIGDQDPAFANARYILALMLERKRVLRPIESQDDRLLVYEHLNSGETFVVSDPRLSLDRIAEVQKEVSQLLADSLRGN